MDFQTLYQQAQTCAEQGKVEEAEGFYRQLVENVTEAPLKALALNDLGCLAQIQGNHVLARTHYERALDLNQKCEPAQQNLAQLLVEGSQILGGIGNDRRIRVAVLSFLFNWPSTGGGIIHTVELATFLKRAGYVVDLIYPQFAKWGLGKVNSCPFPGRPLLFQEAEWTIPIIQQRFRQAVDEFRPDYVLITDSWNIKPYLADAVSRYPYLLRLQAMECLCPLNNLRLLVDAGKVQQCSNNQMTNSNKCVQCLKERGAFSGTLHQWERALCEVETPAYQQLLHKSFAEADAVLTLNQQTANLIAPHVPNVRVVTWGMDPARFPPEAANSFSPRSPSRKTVILFAGLVRESIKGFEVLKDACRRLWQKRQDFELVVTGEADSDEQFLRSIGWRTQSELPKIYQGSDLVVVPSIAQEGLSRTAVEAMASGRPVIGSRLGGMAELIDDGVTGLFVEPGDGQDLAHKIEHLLDHPELRRQFGKRGRQRFEKDFAWPTVIERDYRPLLVRKQTKEKSAIDMGRESPQKENPSVTSCRLEIGPGKHPLPGFETIDMMGKSTHQARWGYDDLATIVGTCSYEEVYASHVLEHIPWNRTLRALKDVFQVLKPGGVFEVWVPNFEYIVDCYQRRICGDSWRRDNAKGDPMLWVNGRVFTYGPEIENYHFACFDYEHLSNCLSQAGLVDIERILERTRGTSHGPIDLGVRCVRPPIKKRTGLEGGV